MDPFKKDAPTQTENDLLPKPYPLHDQTKQKLSSGYVSPTGGKSPSPGYISPTGGWSPSPIPEEDQEMKEPIPPKQEKPTLDPNIGAYEPEYAPDPFEKKPSGEIIPGTNYGDDKY